jgi:RNA polymerase sigma factor (sigma-70 family)
VRVLAVSRRGREVDSFSALVRATALNLAKNRWRSLSRERSALARFKEQDKDRTTVTAAADDGLDFGGALLSLPPRERTAAALFYQLDLSVTDVAHLMAVSPGTVNTLLSRAHTSLLEIMRPEVNRD